MSLEQELQRVTEDIKRDAPAWNVDLDRPEHQFTLWTHVHGRMAHCGSRPSLQAIYRLADQNTGLSKLYVALGPKHWLSVLPYDGSRS